MLLYASQLGSQLPVLTASLHFDGHVGGGGVVFGMHSPQMLVYVLQLGSQMPLLIASLHLDGHSGACGRLSACASESNTDSPDSSDGV